MSFKLHSQLEKDTIEVSDLNLCKVLLMNNALYPWLILVPMKPDLKEITDLSPEDYSLMMEEVNNMCKKMQEIFSPDKMNVATLGNVVPQLHIHIIARFEKDQAWPNPVWGQASEEYSEETKTLLSEKLKLLAK